MIIEKYFNNWKWSCLLKNIVIIEKIMTVEKDCDNWKRSWLLKKIVIIEKINACDMTNSVVIWMRFLR